MKKNYLLTAVFAAALIGASTVFTSCGSKVNSGNSEAPVSNETPAVKEAPGFQYPEFKVKVADLEEFFKTCPDSVTVNLEDYDHTPVLVALATTNKKVVLVIPDGVTELEMDEDKVEWGGECGLPEFPENGSLVKVKIPNSVTRIGIMAFYCCDSLTNIQIPNSITGIGSSAFSNCNKLTSIQIPNSVTNIGGGAFNYCRSLSRIQIPNSVTSIESSTFECCFSLTDVEIPNSVTSIGEAAFEDCSSLTNIEIPNSVTSIGIRAFGNCSSLTTIDIPNSVTSIGNDAFKNCSNLTTIYVSQAIYDTYHEDYPQMVVKKTE
ncbi:MAG: leucine-rich repeat domain-containing protein [Bacteroidales bacterium]|nr:leucine-rich repeat domain-containing protein [Bacteroidales bacterium]